MATKKSKTSKKPTRKASAASQIVSKTAKSAKGLLDRVAQVSAQLVLDSGLLGEAPKAKKKASKKAPAKKAANKAPAKKTRAKKKTKKA
ncbi:MAG: hypothetical protein K0R38_4638 [Polyangiaceae bacterium]|jgi:hypothetical protein|nr:hypothetical protein [Polyangiaceae bacterium]